jgi:hypothetical protein
MFNELLWSWGKLHSGELDDIYCSPNIIRMIKSRRMRWAGREASMGKKINAYMALVGKPEGKRTPGRRRRRQEDNIKMGNVKVKVKLSLCLTN